MPTKKIKNQTQCLIFNIDVGWAMPTKEIKNQRQCLYLIQKIA